MHWYHNERQVIIKTTSGGIVWQILNSTTDKLLWSTYFISDDIGWAVGDWGIIIKTIDEGSH